MNKLFAYGDEYAKQSTWKDFALVKFCVCAMGIMIGLAAPKKISKVLATVAMVVFIVTSIPLFTKFFDIVREYEE